MTTLSRIADLGILPVISPPSAELAEPLAAALIDGGVPAIEITLRSAWALEAIRRIRKAYPEMLIGAGTVLKTGQADDARAAGADFIVAPGFDPALCRHCIERGIPVVPGCSNPSEMTAAINLGLDCLKFFPAEAGGGVAALTLMHGPFAGCSFVPTGGLSLDNIAGYLEKPFVAACGGSFMAKSADIAAGSWAKITDNCRKCLDISLGFELAHVGINHESEAAALDAANLFGKLFRMPVRNGNSSVFAGKAVEQMKTMHYGAKGHIGFTTRSTRRALAWYRAQGVAIREESIRRAADGSIQSFYLADEIAGFAVHVVKRS